MLSFQAAAFVGDDRRWKQGYRAAAAVTQHWWVSLAMGCCLGWPTGATALLGGCAETAHATARPCRAVTRARAGSFTSPPTSSCTAPPSWASPSARPPVTARRGGPSCWCSWLTTSTGRRSLRSPRSPKAPGAPSRTGVRCRSWKAWPRGRDDRGWVPRPVLTVRAWSALSVGRPPTGGAAPPKPASLGLSRAR